MTLSRPCIQKSISKSGIETLSGFKNLSKSNPNFIGSRFVIDRHHATQDPAPEPRPGPTGISLFFDHLIKSATIKKYPENPIFVITLSS